MPLLSILWFTFVACFYNQIHTTIMKLKIHSILFLASLLFVSCNQENMSEEPLSEEAMFEELTETNNLGRYKGVFTTYGSEFRGTIEVIFPPEGATATVAYEEPYAVLTLHTGEQYTAFTENTAEVSIGAVENLRFTSNDFSFDFSVEANGTDVSIDDVYFMERRSGIVAAKSTTRDPAMTLTGTYTCADDGDPSTTEDCMSHPFLENGAVQTFNILRIIDTDDADVIIAQMAFGSTVETSIGEQDNCTTITVGINYQLCVVSGSVNFNDRPVDWTGTHLFNDAGGSCSDMEGTWTWPYNGGTISGTFVADSDEACNVL
ncbi:MAG: hypothetical protein ACPGQR_05995 [Marinirhabdus sp.]